MSDRLEHFICQEPFDAEAMDAPSAALERLYMASQWKMMWWRFARHKLAIGAGIILILSYMSVFFAEVIAPYELNDRNSKYIFAPPQTLHLFDDDKFVGPFVYGYKFTLNMDTLEREYADDRDKVMPIRFLCSGKPYQYWGLFDASFHLVCAAKGGEMFLLGTDRLGRDMASRLIYGGRISLSVGLIGITISFILGISIGGVAGYFGGWVDNVVQRVIEILRSLPELPLWMALSAALPVTWSPIVVYLGITIILGLLDWPGLARAVRSKLLSLREEDYCTAARLMGAKPKRIIGRHLLPNFMSHLIASATLSIPSMILGETALSFLGLGLRPPVTSWGVLLAEAQNIEAVALYPWLMLPMLPVVITVLAFNFLGDGLRDAADPYD
ncbi:MAG TPA: ABC transporter permease [Rhodospirillales bacterium]|nr:ABC transporter permease [Rhodospirillales bacterium]